MRKYILYSLFCLPFLACDSAQDSREETQLSPREKAEEMRVNEAVSTSADKKFLIEESIGNYNIILQLESEYLEVAATNRIKFYIKNVSEDKYRLATPAQEASIIRTEQKRYFDLDVKENAKKVTLAISLKDTLGKAGDETIFLHELDLKTNYDQ